MTLQDWMDREGLTQEQAAERFDSSQPTIQRILAGGHCGPELLKRIYERTGREVTPNDILLRDAA